MAPYPVLRDDAPSDSRARVVACAYLPDRWVWPAGCVLPMIFTAIRVLQNCSLLPVTELFPPTCYRTVPSYLCFLDEAGEVVDFRKLNHLLKRRNGPYEAEGKQKVCVWVCLWSQCRCVQVDMLSGVMM